MNNLTKNTSLALLLCLFSMTMAAQSHSNRGHNSPVIVSSKGAPLPVQRNGEPRHTTINHNEHERTISPEQLDNIVRVLKKESFDSGRLEVAKLCVTLCPISVFGLAKMADVFSFESNRLEFLKFAYEYCPDRENYGKLESSLSFSNNRMALKEHIRRNRHH